MKTLVREPLVHFLALGALLFLFFEWRGGAAGPGSTRIVVTPGLVQHLASGFARTWQRPPTRAELKGLVDEHVKEEIATREAAAMGLERDDTVIRRRLRQKLEFLIEDEVAQAPPTEADLRSWLERHPQAFQAEPRAALRQVFVSAQRRGAAAGAEAQRLLARLRTAGPGASIAELGDPSMLPAELPLGPVSELARTFGPDFAQGVASVPTGQWSGPVTSSYGLHLVLVSERVTPPPPALADVRQLVERELLAERRKAQLEALYTRLLGKYTVTIEMPEEQPRPASVPPGAAAR